jgi:TatD DNase family protein
MIETHCHLDYLKKQSLDETIKMSQEAGVEKIITIAVEPDNFDRVFEISKQYDIVYFTQGIHPHDAIKATEDAFQKIQDRSSEAKMVAVGEIGLDFYYNNSPKEKQIEVFCRQLEIANELDKPVVIHSREADQEMMDCLRKYPQTKGVIHSFTSGQELAEFALAQGLYLGFNGIITFKNAQNVRDIVEITPLERILTETDAPFLTPVPHRGKENAPFYLPHVIEKIAEIKKANVNSLKNNAISLFSI